MESPTQKQLINEHARLTAQFVNGNAGAKKRLEEIEKELGLSPIEIARLAADLYLRDY